MSQCGDKQGPCLWCGSDGMCCTKKSDWTDASNGCDGTFGGLTQHECVLPRKYLELSKSPYILMILIIFVPFIIFFKCTITKYNYCTQKKFVNVVTSLMNMATEIVKRGISDLVICLHVTFTQVPVAKTRRTARCIQIYNFPQKHVKIKMKV